ncbi:MAG: hypothetical protein ACYCPN_07230 [Thermoplasmata archaeon]
MTLPAGSPARIAPARWVELLRIGLGLIWLANLVFIVDPANQFFSTYGSTVLSYGPSTPALLGGAALTAFVAAHADLFAGLTALVTAYLAGAFLSGVTVRPAIVVGTIFTVLLLVTQWGQTFGMPGGTDVGPMPLYLLIYALLWIGGAGTALRLWTPRRSAHPECTGAPARAAPGPESVLSEPRAP